jgi:hypothetical protein
LSLAVGHLLVAEHLFLSRTDSEEDLPAWIRAIMDAHDVAHVDPASTFGRFLVSLAAPPTSLHLFGARPGGPLGQRAGDRSRPAPTSSA